LRACLDAGGSITGEHGVGVEKEAYIAWMFDAESLACMALIKAVFDPNQRLNPGKLVPLRRGCAEVPQSRKVFNHA
jgi:glycolate oxidase